MNTSTAAIESLRQDVRQLARQAPAPEMAEAERVAAAKQVFMKRMTTEFAVNLESCIQCGMCAEVCHFHAATRDPRYAPVVKFQPLRRFYRRELSPIRWLNRLFIRDIRASDLKAWQELVYHSCTACGRCDMICPMGIGISETVRVMREGLAAAGLIPDELRAVDKEQMEQGTVLGVGPEQFHQIVEELRGEGIDIPVDKDEAEVLVLTTALNLRLFRNSLAATAKIMNRLGISWTMRRRAFDANNFGYLSGNHEAQKLETRRIIDEAMACGASTVIVPECGHAYPALRWEGDNEYGKPLPFEVLAISEFIGREIAAGRLRVKANGNGKAMTFHDPCRMGRHGGLLEEPRAALKALGADLREMESHGRTNFCCGGGEGVNLIGDAAELRQKAFAIKMREVDDCGAETVVTSCDSCRYNFITGGEKANWNKPIASLVEMVADNLAD